MASVMKMMSNNIPDFHQYAKQRLEEVEVLRGEHSIAYAYGYLRSEIDSLAFTAQLKIEALERALELARKEARGDTPT